MRHIVIPRAAVYGTVAALILLAVALVLRVPRQENASPIDSAAQGQRAAEPVVVARLLEVVEAQWDGAAPSVGDSLAAEAYHLRQGLAHIAFVDGGRVLIEAPAMFRLDAENAMRLQSGRLVGYSPPGAKDLLVRTPTARIADLGTEFGVAVDDSEETEVHVLDGIVEVRLPNSETRHRFARDQAVRIGSGGDGMKRIEADAFAFIRGMQPEDRDPLRRYVHLVQTSNPIAYWRLNDAPGGVVLNEMSKRYAARLFGNVLVGSDMVQPWVVLGRSPGTYLSVPPIEELRDADSYTFECWIRREADSLGTIFRLAGDDPRLTCLALEVVGPQPYQQLPARSIRFLHRNPPDLGGGTDLFADWSEPLHAWQHIVAVKDGPTLYLYVNGHRVGTARDDTPMPADLGNLYIGRFEMDEPRPFRGALMHAAVYDHALTAKEVDRHYRAMPLHLLSDRLEP